MKEIERFNIFNEKYELTIKLSSGRMGHLIANFSIKDNSENKIIINALSSNWDLYKWTEKNGNLKMSLRKYPHGNNIYKIEINLEEQLFEYKNRKYQIPELFRVLNLY